MANVKISNLPTETDVANIQGVAGYRTNTNSGELETVQFTLGPLKTSDTPGLKSGQLLIESNFAAGGSNFNGIELKTNANAQSNSSILISSNGGGSSAALKLRSKTDIQVDLHSQNSNVSAPTVGNFLIAKDADGNLEWSDKTFADVPTDNNQLTNGAGYITSAAIPTTIDWGNVSNKPSTFAPIIGTGATEAMAGDTTIPTNNNQLTNGAGYVTSAAIPTNNNQLSNGAGYITSVPVIDLSDSTQVTGVLPIANGGTDSDKTWKAIQQYVWTNGDPVSYDNFTNAQDIFLPFSTSPIIDTTLGPAKWSLSTIGQGPFGANDNINEYTSFNLETGGSGFWRIDVFLPFYNLVDFVQGRVELVLTDSNGVVTDIPLCAYAFGFGDPQTSNPTPATMIGNYTGNFGDDDSFAIRVRFDGAGGSGPYPGNDNIVASWANRPMEITITRVM